MKNPASGFKPPITKILTMFFRDDDPDIDGSEMYPGYRSTFEEGSFTIEIAGIAVRYREYSSNRFEYEFFSEFEYGGNIYFLDTFSKKNKNLSWDTLTNMLDPNKSEWLTLKEDVTLQNLPGAKKYINFSIKF